MVENSHAEDTLEGIVEWWLLEHRIRRQTARVQDAINELVTLGYVSVSGPPERPRYQLNRDHWDEIVELCKAFGEAEP
jgi:hypothetical protein